MTMTTTKNSQRIGILMFLTLILSPGAVADNLFDTYNCALTVTRGEKVVVDIESEIRVSRFASHQDDHKASVEAFEGLRGLLTKKMVFPGFFMVKAVAREDSTVPELNIGVYQFNKFMPSKMALMHSASGDARSFTKLSARINEHTSITFTCRNKFYLDI